MKFSESHFRNRIFRMYEMHLKKKNFSKIKFPEQVFLNTYNTFWSELFKISLHEMWSRMSFWNTNYILKRTFSGEGYLSLFPIIIGLVSNCVGARNNRSEVTVWSITYFINCFLKRKTYSSKVTNTRCFNFCIL